MGSYARILSDAVSVRQFFTDVLEYDFMVDGKKRPVANVISSVMESENGIAHLDDTAFTLVSKKYRVNFTEEPDRWTLRKRIVNELFEKTRLDSDEKIKLGKGGAAPKQAVKADKQAIIITGLPASGKSSIASQIADEYGAYILDSDFAKRKLPEYSLQFGAHLVHEESDAIIFNHPAGKSVNFTALLQLCVKENYNIVLPKIGYSTDSINRLANILNKNFGYDVHLVLVSLDRQKATIRALNRFIKTKRYVPLSHIFDGYGNDPILTYYRLKKNEGNLFMSFGKVITDSPHPVCIDCIADSPVRIFKSEINEEVLK